MTEERKPTPDDMRSQPEQPTTPSALSPQSPEDVVSAAGAAQHTERATTATGQGVVPPRWARRKSQSQPGQVPLKAHKRNRWSERAKHPAIVGGNAALTILLVFLVVAAAVVEYGRQRFYGQGPLSADTTVVIPKGLGVRQIGDLLEERNVISHKWTFVMGLQFSGDRSSLQAGEYSFPAGASMNDVAGIISSGKVVEHPVTLAEGLTSEQIVKRLNEMDVLSGEIKQIPPEGSLLPDTYRVTRGTPREQLVARMTQARDKALKDIWERRDPDTPLKSPFELLILASIVEKETGIASERPRVAAVFANRLNKNMRLQSDPTIIYGLVGGKGSLGRPILKSEISRRTPYNTYVINGLPPGPIANVGREALEAAARPADTDDLYFVADGTGGHAFSASYNEHRSNVVKLRQIERAGGVGEPDRVTPEDAEEIDSNAAPAASGRRS